MPCSFRDSNISLQEKSLDDSLVIFSIDISPGLANFKEEFWNKGISNMQMKLGLQLCWIVFRSKIGHDPSASQIWYLS